MAVFEPALPTLITQSVEETIRIGHQLGRLLQAGDVICLAGSLGAGKTALTRGIGQAWGALEAVTSPTFTLVHEHRRRQDAQILYHIDCYRLRGSTDAWSIGFDDFVTSDGILIIEWPENIADVLPPEHLWIDIVLLDETRRSLTFHPTGRRFRALTESLLQAAST